MDCRDCSRLTEQSCKAMVPGAVCYTEQYFIEQLSGKDRYFWKQALKEKLTEKVTGLMEVSSVNFAGETTLRESIALMSLCSIVISNDTGGMHIAAALGKPVAALFGPTEHWNTAPLGENHLILRQPVPCSPCMLRDCPIDHRCFRLLTIDRVRREMDNWLFTIPPEFQPH